MIKFKFETDTPYGNELPEVIRAFEPTVLIDETEQSILFLSQKYNNFKLTSSVYLNNKPVFERNDMLESCAPIVYKRFAKRYAKLSLYSAISILTGEELPWGSLTGIRPTKLAYELLAEDGEEGIERLKTEFFVSERKIGLVKRIINAQNGIRSIDSKNVDLFVNIPFCVSRCAYCSFLAGILPQKQKLVEPYLDCLLREIAQVKAIIAEKGLKVRTIYVGGGTPTALNIESLKRLLDALFDFSVSEFTVESGRPDTITAEKLELFKKYNVTRICINPQTFNEKTLEAVNRRHTIQQIYDSYALARQYGFDINMDLIAMLPNETGEDIINSVKCAAALKPENITLHALSVKRGSAFAENEYKNFNGNAQEIIEKAGEILTKNGYEPYYLYRQKHTCGNLENTGYSLPEKVCVYNVDIMEETTSIIVAGASAIAKRIFGSGERIERCANVKNIEEYIRLIDEMLESQKSFWN